MARFGVLAALAMLCACSRGQTTPSPREPPTPSSFVERDPVEPTSPREAWFLIDDAVVRLDADGYTTIPGSSGIYVVDLFLAGDGRGYLVTGEGIRTLVGDEMQMVVEFSEDAFGTQAAVGPDAYLSLWQAGNQLSHWRGGTWTTEVWEERLTRDIAFDPTGTAWVLGLDRDGDSRLWHLGPAGWVMAEFGEGHAFHPSAQALYALGDDYLMRIEGPSRIDRIDLDLPAFPELDGETTRWFGRISINADGDVALAAKSDFIRFEGDRKVAMTVTLDGYEVLEGFGFDASDRIWVSSSLGITVVEPDGEQSEISRGSVPELRSWVRDLVVLGEGPALPDPTPVRRGSVRGGVLLSDAPLPDGKVLACAKPAASFNPCRSAKSWASTTDAKGRFSIVDLPIGEYVFVVALEPVWVKAGSFEVREGEQDVGWFTAVPW
jgi:hypothetical protein